MSMPRFGACLVVGAAALLTAATTSPAEAGFVVNSDAEFTAKFGSPTTFAEVQGQSGQKAGSTALSAEAQIFSNSGASSANFPGFWQDGPVDFTASYNGAVLSFTGTRDGTELFDVRRWANLTGAESIFLRAAADANSSTSLTNLEFEGTSLPSISASGPSAEQYVGLNFANLQGAWSLSGTAELVGIDSNARPAFQLKVTDAVVPLPAAAWMMISGLAAVGGVTYRRRQKAAAA